MNLGFVQVRLSSQTGFSLPEIMVALVLGLVVTGTAMQIFISSRHTYRVDENLARIHEDGILAMQIMANDLRQAGYFGCSSRVAAGKMDYNSQFSVIANAVPTIVIQAGAGQNAVDIQALTGGNNAQNNQFADPNPILNTSPGFNGNILRRVVDGTDAFTVQYAEAFTVRQPASECDGALVGLLDTVDPTNAIKANNCDDLSFDDPGTALVVSDCDNVHVFRAARLGDTSQNTENGLPTDKLSRLYSVKDDQNGVAEMSAPPEVMYLRSYTYYIREDGETGQPSLFRLDNTSRAAPIALVEGAENMQLIYGVDSDGDASIDSYLDASQITSWENVMQVRIDLTMHSYEDNLTTDSRTYSYNNADNHVDHRMSKSFSLTVNLRNRR